MPKDDLEIKNHTVKKKSLKSEQYSENTDIQINKAKEYLKKTNTQLTNRLDRIDKIKKSHERFEEQIEVLQSGKFTNRQENLIDMVNDIIEIPDAIKVNSELSGLVEKYAVKKLDLMKKLFANEKKQTRELNEKLKENLSQLAMSEHKIKLQRNNLQIDLREKTKKLAQVERLSAIGELSARLAHDLRNPLTVIKGVVEIARARTISSETYFSTKQIDMMERAVARMSNQIDDVLEFVKIQSLHTRKNSLLDTLGLSLAKINKSPNIKIHIPDKVVEFVYDSDKIEIVFDNLINNSIQAINDDDGEITIRFIDLESEVKIEVQDSGDGISNEIMSKVFEPLFTTKKKGTGLGLASCKSIVEQHGGSISISNKPTVFTINLPKLVEISTI